MAAAAAYYYNGRRPQAQQSEEPTITTDQVRRGDLTITADGSGTLVPGSEAQLGFFTGGVLTEVLVKVGDQVQAGDALAGVDETDAAKAVASAELQVLKAQLDLASAETHLLTVQEGSSDGYLLW